MIVFGVVLACFLPVSPQGVVGRTGAGKSSLGAALARLAEGEAGTLLVGGIRAQQCPLHILRSAIAAVPQDPTLFQASLRRNLDPAATSR